MIKFRKYIGLYFLVIILGFLIASFLLDYSKALETKDFVLSDLGVFDRSSIVFNSGLIISGLVLYIFLLDLFQPYRFAFIYRWLLTIPATSLLLIGVFRFDVAATVHWIAAIIFFFSFPIIWITLVILKGKLNFFTMFLVLSSVFQFIVFALLAIEEPTRLAAEVIFGIILGIQIIIWEIFNK